MGYTTSSIHGIEVPNSAEANDVPEDIGKVVTALEGGSFARRLTGAQIAALTGAQKTAGVQVYNTTTNKLQISDGTNFADTDATAAAAQATAAAALPKAGGTMTGPIAMGSQKVTGLASGTASGDAVNRSQLDAVQARVAHGGANTVGGVFNVTITPPAGMTLRRVVCSVNGASVYFLAGNGYQQVVVGAEIQNAATGSTNINRRGVGSGADTTALTIYVDYIAYFA